MKCSSHASCRGKARTRDGGRRFEVLVALICLLIVQPLPAAENAAERAQELTAQVVLLFKEGKYAEAKRFAEELVSIREGHASSTGKSTGLHILGRIHEELGDYKRAEELYCRAVQINEELGRADERDSIEIELKLGSLYRSMVEFGKAEGTMLRALRRCENALGEDDALTALACNNLGGLYEVLNDYPRAEAFYKRSLAIREKVYGPDNPYTVWVLDNLASVAFGMRNIPEATSLSQRVLAAYGSAADIDPLICERSLIRLARVYIEAAQPNLFAPLETVASDGKIKNDRQAKALLLLERVVELNEEFRDSEHSETARSLHELAMLYLSLGQFSKGAELEQRALKITEKALGADHPQTAMVANNLAVFYLAMEKPADAVRLARISTEIFLKELGKILSFTSEQQRLAYVSGLSLWTQFGTVGSAQDLARLVVRLKGVVLDSLIEDRLVNETSMDMAQRDILLKLKQAKQQLLEIALMAREKVSEEVLARRRSLEAAAEEMEKTLAAQIAGVGQARRALTATPAQIQAVLPRDTVIIEYLAYDHYVGMFTLEWRYGAVIIPSAGEPKWVPLSTLALIDRKVALYQRAVRGEADQSSLPTVLRSLHRHVWEPVERALPEGTKTVIISPDGELNFVSFATLLDSTERFVADKYLVRYVASARDLLRPVAVSAEQRMVIYADPDFTGTPTSQEEKVPRASASQPPLFAKRAFAGIDLTRLPGTAKESRALGVEAAKAGWTVEILRQKAASENHLRQLVPPRILHLATHGFFLPLEREAPASSSASFRGVGGIRPNESAAAIPAAGRIAANPNLINPMYRSGLALAGAQHTLDLWAKEKVLPTESDGILTAAEVGGLNLKGSWLVTLSACDTGRGEARSGEGVMGLRRSFLQAGAQNLVLCLWSVADEETARFMVDFYKAANQRSSAADALAKVKREWLSRLRKDRGLAAAVRLAGPFILNSQGPLK